MAQNFVRVLLGTFTTIEYLDSSLHRIFSVFRLENNKIFVFNDTDNQQKKILTYNILVPEGQRADISKVFHTICINRKKESNTLYTINSLNRLVEQEVGKVDKDHKVDWSKYRNVFITSDKESNGIIVIKTGLDTVVEKTEYYANRQRGSSGQPISNASRPIY